MAPTRSSPELPRLGDEERLRYSRHLLLPELGLEGQRRLKAGRVLLVGAGGLGSPAALYLAAAGVGLLGIVDSDAVDATNLHRQVLHGARDVGRRKVDSARDRLRDLNPHVEVVAHDTRLTAGNALELVRGYDLVVDGADNFPTRYLVNDACVLLGRPDVHASISRFEGQASVFCTPGAPCYRCLHPEPPPPGLVASCAEAGVLGILPGLLGVVQATEAIKLLAGLGEPLAGRLLLVDALRMEFRSVRLARDPRCRACGAGARRALADTGWSCAPAAAPEALPVLTVAQLRARLGRGEGELDLVDVRERHEWDAGRIEGARLLPLSMLADPVGAFDPERDTVIYCRSGVRSAAVVERLCTAGYRRVWNLEGGILEWERAGHP